MAGALIVFAIIAGVAFVVALLWNSQHCLRLNYQRLADHYQGKMSWQGWSDPRVQFNYKDTRVLVNIGSTGGRHSVSFTQVQLLWPDSQFRCEIYPEGFWSRLKTFLGMRDVEIGAPDFDHTYVITGSSIDGLREFLTGEVQRDINELRSIGEALTSFTPQTDQTVVAGDINVSIRGGRLLIKKCGLIQDFVPLEHFVKLSLQLYDHAMAASIEGISFVEPSRSRELTSIEAVCQICGEMVKLDAVYCRGCKTPHHKDCWEYYGACSTYGCGQKKYASR